MRSRKETFQEILDLKEMLADLKGRRDRMIARRDWNGEEMSDGSEDLGLSAGQPSEEAEGMKTPTMPAAMRAAMATQQQQTPIPGQHHPSQNMAQPDFNPAMEQPQPQSASRRTMSIGQQIYSLEGELSKVTHTHEEYGRMFKIVGDNIEQMWDEVAKPKRGWPEERWFF